MKCSDCVNFFKIKIEFEEVEEKIVEDCLIKPGMHEIIRKGAVKSVECSHMSHVRDPLRQKGPA